MILRLQTANPEFLSDIGDVLRLFYGSVTFSEDAEEALTHTLREEDGFWTDEWRWNDQAVSLVTPVCRGNFLEVKRQRKRAVKMGLYRLLRRITGIRPPWGALTGIRPTRLLYEGMARGLTLPEAVARVEREFDVLPDRAALLGEIAEMQQGILYPAEDEFDLYIGIPFCATRCSYCSFASGEIGDGRLVEPYVAALLREIESCGRLMRARGLRLRAGYVGGGTPTAIPCEALSRILTAAQSAFPGAREWTVEAGRPDTIDREKLVMLKDHGIGRVSVNPQTFSDETLKRIGRAHTGADTVRAYALARALGFDDINMDLIAALPGETPDDFAATVGKVVELNPDSVTVHSLAIKHSSKLHERICTGEESALSDAGAADMIAFARRALTEAGWRPYYLYRQKYMAGNLENVGYAKPGKACLYNIGNMEETASVLALGAGAITKWLDPHTEVGLRIERAANVRSVEQYIARVDEMVERKRALILPEEGCS